MGCVQSHARLAARHERRATGSPCLLLRVDGVRHGVGGFFRGHFRVVHEGGDGVHDRAAIFLQDGHVVGHRAHQHAVGDRGLQILLRLLLAGVEVLADRRRDARESSPWPG